MAIILPNIGSTNWGDTVNNNFTDLDTRTTDNHDKIGVLNTSITKISDEVNYIHGIEYLTYYHNKLRNKQATKIVWSGDSQICGISLTDTNYLISTLCKNLLQQYGVRNSNSINKGHSGAKTPEWVSTYIAEDLALVPDLYIPRWGANDSNYSPFADRVAAYENSLRTGLTNIRAQKTVKDMSIILMTPLSTDDPYNKRTPEWFEAITPIIKQASRDFQCCFIDIYHYLKDSKNAYWQDEINYGDGYLAHVHPLETANVWIIDLMSEVLIPKTFKNYGVTNLSSSVIIKTLTDKPSTYPLGVSVYRTDGTFPLNGIVYTIKSYDGTIFQTNLSYASQTTENIVIRRGFENIGVSGSIGDDAWANWINIRSNEPWQNLTLQNGWLENTTDGGTPKFYKDSSGNVHVIGCIKSGTTTMGAVIFNLPVGYRPLQSCTIPVACGGNFGIVKLNPNGDVVALIIPYNNWVDFGTQFVFRAEQ